MKSMKWLATGLLAVSVGGLATCSLSGSRGEGDEVKVPAAQLPAAVRATLAREAPGVTITEADKETDKGKTIYEADALIAGANYEIKVAEDGTLISKTLDQEEEATTKPGR